VGMIYDDEMRDRIVQLLRNEYQDWELDTLVNRYISYGILGYEREALKICKFDTMQIFKHIVDSFYIDIKNKNPKDSSIIRFDYAVKANFKYAVFKFLQLDTTAVFKQAYNEIVEREKKRKREDYLTNKTIDYTSLIELCGYIGDKRFVKPLIEILEYKLTDYQHKALLEALARMRVEPYYSNYVKKRTLTATQIKDEKWLDFSLDDFVYVLGTQEAFLELSKYLLSNKPYTMEVFDNFTNYRSEAHIHPVSQGAFYLIRDHIKNEDIQKMIGPNREDIEVLFKPLYDWMQKNYGKYKIRRIW
jgi:hypothetical protein